MVNKDVQRASHLAVVGYMLAYLILSLCGSKVEQSGQRIPTQRTLDLSCGIFFYFLIHTLHLRIQGDPKKLRVNLLVRSPLYDALIKLRGFKSVCCDVLNTSHLHIVLISFAK